MNGRQKRSSPQPQPSRLAQSGSFMTICGNLTARIIKTSSPGFNLSETPAPANDSGCTRITSYRRYYNVLLNELAERGHNRLRFLLGVGREAGFEYGVLAHRIDDLFVAALDGEQARPPFRIRQNRLHPGGAE